MELGVCRASAEPLIEARFEGSTGRCEAWQASLFATTEGLRIDDPWKERAAASSEEGANDEQVRGCTRARGQRLASLLMAFEG